MKSNHLKKLLLLLLCTGVFSAAGVAIAQQPVTKSLSIHEALKKITKAFGTEFMYDGELLREKKTSYDLDNIRHKSLEEVLKGVLYPNGFLFVYLKENYYTIVPKDRVGEAYLKSTSSANTPNIYNTNTTANQAQQSRNISGTVVNSSGSPLDGVSITAKNAGTGTTTNANGNFRILVNENDVLVISSVGFIQQEIKIDNQENIKITLEDQQKTLDEVVVIGYGTQRKSDLTGSVVSLRKEDFNKAITTSVAQLIQGRAPGVQVTQSSGAPGGGVSIRIRGSSSINAGNEPLYVIDGLLIDNAPSITANGIGFTGSPPPSNPLNALNPSDIEAVEILKDASATAIYGSRGANGVILITTKRGKEGILNIDYNFLSGTSTVSHKMDLLNTGEYINVMNELAKARGVAPVFSPAQIQEIGNGTDWQDVIYRSAFSHNHNLSLSGGSNKTTFFTSFNYNKQKGIILNTDFERFQGRVNLEHKASEKFKFGINLNSSLIKNNEVPTNGTGLNQEADVINTTLNVPPVFGVFDANGNYIRPENGVLVSVTLDNPLALANGIRGHIETNRTFGNLYGDYTILPGLSARLSFGSDRTNSRRDVYQSTLTNRGRATGGNATIATGELSNYLLEGLLTYTKEINNRHSINAVAGYTYQQFDLRRFNGSILGFTSDLTTTNNLGLGNTNFDDLSSLTTRRRLISYLGRVNYSFNRKYLFTASFRADGSSNFGANNKYGIFPSFSTAWRISEETFIKNTDIFSDLKLRLGWGQIGNDDIGIGNAFATYNNARDAVFGNVINPGLSPTRIPNPDLKWETTEQFNLGLDFGFLRGRISGTFDYFIKNTKDLLIALPIPGATGFNSITQNVGEIRNSGFEILINSKNIDKKFRWNTSLNFSTVKNRVVSLGSIPSIINTLYATSVIATPGVPLFSYYGYQAEGIFQNLDEIAKSAQAGTAVLGVPKWRDVNADGVINDKDRTVLGKAFPDFTYGINNAFSYKNFDLSVFVEGTQGFSLYNATVVEALYPNDPYRNRLAVPLLNRWTPQNPTNAWPSGVDITKYRGGSVNSFTVTDASYVRLKNVQLSYQFKMGSKKFLRSASIYIAGQNLATITNYLGYDPDVNSTSSSTIRLDRNSYPSSRTISLGGNFGF